MPRWPACVAAQGEAEGCVDFGHSCGTELGYAFADFFCRPCGTWFPLWLIYPGLTSGAKLCRRSAAGMRAVLFRASNRWSMSGLKLVFPLTAHSRFLAPETRRSEWQKYWDPPLSETGSSWSLRVLRCSRRKKTQGPSTPQTIAFAMICSGRDDRVGEIETSPLKPEAGLSGPPG